MTLHGKRDHLTRTFFSGFFTRAGCSETVLQNDAICSDVTRSTRPGCTAKVAGKRRWFALREKRRRLALSRKVSSMIVLWHSIAFENIMMVDEVPFSRYYAIKLFCVKWSLFPRRVTYGGHGSDHDKVVKRKRGKAKPRKAKPKSQGLCSACGSSTNPFRPS